VAQAWGPADRVYTRPHQPVPHRAGGAWIAECGAGLREVRLRGLIPFAVAGLAPCGPRWALPRNARMLTELAPSRDRHRLLMEALAGRHFASAPRLRESCESCSEMNSGSRPAPPFANRPCATAENTK